MLPTRLHTIVLMDNHITKSLYGLDYEYNTSLRVIGAALSMQKSHLQKVAKLGKEKGRLVEKPRIRDMVCDLFHIGSDAYKGECACKGDTDPPDKDNADCSP
jgi:hypothetical protein